MKEVIDLLENAEHSLRNISVGLSASTNSDIADGAIACIRTALAKLKAPPRYETPEQYKKRMGKEWPDDWAAYTLYGSSMAAKKWHCVDYGFAKMVTKNIELFPSSQSCPPIMVIASEAGKPPDGWMPEEII